MNNFVIFGTFLDIIFEKNRKRTSKAMKVRIPNPLIYKDLRILQKIRTNAVTFSSLATRAVVSVYNTSEHSLFFIYIYS